MVIDKKLFAEFLREYPFQPATAFWRMIEVTHILSQPFPEGFGLELGCGDGKVTQILMNKIGYRDLIGVDIDFEEVGLARQLNIYKQVHLTCGSNIPEANDSFDFVFSNSVLEHVDKIDETIEEIARLLKPGGSLLITVPGKKFHDGLKGPLLPFGNRESYLKYLDEKLLHLRYWDEYDWQKTLAVHGIKILQTTSYFNIPEVQRWENIARFTSGVLCEFFGRKKKPIEIQRILGLRKSKTKIPLILANILSNLFLLNLNNMNKLENKLKVCLMIEAVKL